MTKARKLSKTQKMLNVTSINRIVSVVSRRTVGRVEICSLRVRDGYHGARYKPERWLTRLAGRQMEAYLAKRQHLDFNHPKNKVKKLLYSLPALNEWSGLMPGALALEPIYHPGLRRLPTGRRLDLLTGRIFRHGLDTVGVRTRTLTGGWIAHGYAAARPGQSLLWVSLAGGTAAPTMLMVAAAGIDASRLQYIDVDRDAWAIELARQVTALQGLTQTNTKLLQSDIFDKSALEQVVRPSTADVVDLMGIFEYLDDEQSAALLKIAYDLLKPAGILIACNMRVDHPQLNVHRRGVGWPGIIQRSEADIESLCLTAGISSNHLTIYQPLDGVYHVMRVTKA